MLVLGGAAGDKDMFSTEFQVASADHRKLDRELTESQADQAQAAKSQRQSSAADE